MRDMAIGQKCATVANLRFPFARRATADCNEFAKRVLIADFQIGRFALIFQILRLLTDRAGGIKFIQRTCTHRSAQRDMLLQPTIWTEDDVRTNYAIRTDDCSRAEFGSGIDNCRGMNLHFTYHCQPLTSVLSPPARGEAEGLAQ